MAGDSVPTIVCVDDDTLILRSLREQLLRGLDTACDIELASSAEEALALIDELDAEGADVPLIISDQVMPGQHGADLLAEIHRRRPSTLKILLTGQADVAAIGTAVNEANLYRLIGKPWQEQDLVLTVREALRRVSQERELARRTAELEEANRELERSMQLLNATMDATLDGLLVLDRQGQPTRVNRQFIELWTIPEPVARLEAAQALVSHLRTQLADPTALQLDPKSDIEEPSLLELRDGRAVEYRSRAQRLDGDRVGSVFSFRDVTERERTIERIRFEALHDPLSGLPNRNQFDGALARAIESASRSNAAVAVMFVDLDHFKRINDELGHDAGDRLLQVVARRLDTCLRDGDLIARWGGDEFTVLLPRLPQTEEAEVIARRLLKALAPPIQLGELSVRISASIGMATFPQDGQDSQTLLRHADSALYEVKAGGRNGYRSYCAAHDAHFAASGLALESDLHGAAKRGELRLHYQPQVDSRTGTLFAVEALVRWNHPRRGLLGPAHFIPLAEQSGIIVDLGEWVLKSACMQVAHWHAQGFDQLRLAVNLSAVQFEQGDLLASVDAALAASGLPPSHLELEITEALALRNLGATVRILEALRARGISIALDDFGTGHASLSYLRDLPCNTVKIDRSFVREIAPATREAAIVSALVTLGERLGIRILAEGVESRPTAEHLQQLGCWLMQGYLYGRPVDAASLTPKVLDGLELPAVCHGAA
ncbi:MAG: EAL domain-containing protein [Rhodocyclaceae bacterium]|nr:EAL domain-containing protein [Rhodocyclaceae bacterium]